MDSLSNYTLNTWKFETKASEAKRGDADDDEAAGARVLRWMLNGPKVSEVDIHVTGSTFLIAESTKD